MFEQRVKLEAAMEKLAPFVQEVINATPCDDEVKLGDMHPIIATRVVLARYLFMPAER